MSIQGEILTQINKSIIGVTEHTRAHPDDFNPNVLKPLLDNDVTINRQLEALPSKPVSFNPGYQFVESEHDAPFRLGEIKGRTLVNLAGGPTGNCEDASVWKEVVGDGELSVDNEKKDTGNGCLKVKLEGKGSGEIRGVWELKTRIPIEDVKTGATYLWVARIMNGTAARVSVSALAEYYHTDKDVEDSTKFNTVRKAFTLKQPETNSISFNIWVYGQPGTYAYIDSIRLFKLSDQADDALVAKINNMERDELNRQYPFSTGIANVRNPYAIVTGGNLLPPFYEWDFYAPEAKVQAPYAYTQSDALTGGWTRVRIRTIPNTDYYLTFSSPDDGEIAVFSADETKVLLGYGTGGKFNSGNLFEVVVYIRGAQTATIVNPILTIGTEPKPFAPQQRSMSAYETVLAAHPVDDSNPDTLFLGDDGLPYVLEFWRKLNVSGNYAYALSSNTNTTFKVVSARNIDVGVYHPTSFMIDYTGKLLKYSTTPVTTWTEAGLYRVSAIDIGETETHVWMALANTDSGWGPDYKPTQDEIKAYFLGWKMYDISGVDPTAIGTYNRTDGLHKGWTPLQSFDGTKYEGGYTGSGTPSTYPNTFNTTRYHVNRTWQPYRLQYLKAKPTVEPVRNYELGATLSTGPNMVEVGSGIVIREKANPALYADNYVYLNNKAVDKAIGSNCSFRYNASTLLEIYKDRANEIRKWTMLPKHDSAYGEILALIPQSNFDPSAVYHVTYTMLTPTIAAPIRGTVAANLRGTVSDLVQDVGDIGRRLSVVETQKAEKDAPQWIDLSLLSGWKNVYIIKAGFYKNDNGIVQLRGRMSGGTLTNGTVIAKLPKGYGVTSSEHIIPVWDGTSGPIKAGLVTIKNNDVSIWNVPSDAKDIWLDDISFKTDQ